MKIEILFGDAPQQALILDLGDNFISRVRSGNLCEVLNVQALVNDIEQETFPKPICSMSYENNTHFHYKSIKADEDFHYH